ncbi:MAG: hypothetical protein ACAH83_19925 [Alphaproteobacteria bacterium]
MTDQKRKRIAVIAAIALVIASFVPLLMAGKAGPAVLDKIANPGEVAVAKQLFAQLAAHDIDAIASKADPEIASPELRTTLRQMADIFPNEQPRDIKLLGYHFFKTVGADSGAETVTTTLEYQFSKTWLMADITLRKKDGGEARITGLHVKPQADSIENMTRFRLSGQSGLHYAVMTLAVVELLFCAYVLMLCIKTPIPKRKWLWVLFVMAGFPEFRFNWMTGVIFFNPLVIRIPTVQFSQGLYEPYFVVLMLPIGALVFLARRKKWLAGTASPS